MAYPQADQAAVPTREKEVISAFRTLMQTIESLEQTTQSLCERISPVLSIEPPQPIEKAEKLAGPRGYGAKVAQELAEATARIERVIQACGSVGRRIEV